MSFNKLAIFASGILSILIGILSIFTIKYSIAAVIFLWILASLWIIIMFIAIIDSKLDKLIKKKK